MSTAIPVVTPTFPQASYAQQGWECPKCKRVYSPTIPFCLYCQPLKVETVADVNPTLLNENEK